MIKRFTVKNVRFTLTIARVAKVIGVNSELEDGRHILMWDFDEVKLEDVVEALKYVQVRYMLSDIHLLRSKEPDNYLAYCFTACDWRRAVEIIASTQGVDWQFFRFGVYRGHFTLRVTPKNGRIPYLAERLEGCELPDCKPSDLKSWVRYETLNWR